MIQWTYLSIYTYLSNAHTLQVSDRHLNGNGDGTGKPGVLPVAIGITNQMVWCSAVLVGGFSILPIMFILYFLVTNLFWFGECELRICLKTNQTPSHHCLNTFPKTNLCGEFRRMCKKNRRQPFVAFIFSHAVDFYWFLLPFEQLQSSGTSTPSTMSSHASRHCIWYGPVNRKAGIGKDQPALQPKIMETKKTAMMVNLK